MKKSSQRKISGHTFRGPKLKLDIDCQFPNFADNLVIWARPVEVANQQFEELYKWARE